MGFGLLLIGYFLTNILPVISVFSFAMLFGYPLMIAGLYRLAPYDKRFYYSMWCCLPSLAFSLYYTVSGFMAANIIPQIAIFGGTVFFVVEWIYFFYTLALNLMILRSVACFTGEMGLFRVQSNAWRNLTFVLIYHAVYFAIHLPIPFLLSHGSAFALPVTLLRYLCVLLNLWLFFLCYSHILPEGSDTTECKKEERNK